MRKVAVWGFVAVALLFTGVQAQRPAPAADAAASRPTQVEVTNFPAVQEVGGAVNVGNLPAVQPVSGSVQVTNLPVDADGNLRVSGQQPPVASQFTKIVDGLLVDHLGYEFGPIPVAGWRRFSILTRVTGTTDVTPWSPDPIHSCTDSCITFHAAVGGDGAFVTNLFHAGAATSGCVRTQGQSVVGVGSGEAVTPEVRLRIGLTEFDTCFLPNTVTVDVWLYLSN